MSEFALRSVDLGKQYRIGSRFDRHATLREVISGVVRAPFSSRKNSHGETPSTIWALRDVSFTVAPGEVIGVIGRNGAGKSTLLKILSRITDPTEGFADIAGRVGSLLEVGTGFHPELTGRENIFLNGAILGMRRSEIVRRFDEIVTFAEVEQFIDTPVKRYSSGMTVRLAFAVAAHLEPEVLLVDEVLSVGDASFQRKSLGKMGEVVGEGRTVVFVSHQLGLVTTLCGRAILLDQGRIVDSGPSAAIVDRYVRTLADAAGRRAVEYAVDPLRRAQILSAEVSAASGIGGTSFDVFDPVTLSITYCLREAMGGVGLNLVARRNGDVLFVSFDTDDDPSLLAERSPGTYSVSVCLPSPLKSGRYTLDLSIGRLNVGGLDVCNEAIAFDVEERSFDTSLAGYSSKRPGVMAVHLAWQSQAVAPLRTG